MKTFITKLTSRKFLLALAVFITSLVAIDDNTLSLIASTVTAIAYMFSEAIVDKARAVKREFTDTAYVSKVLPTGEVKNNADE